MFFQKTKIKTQSHIGPLLPLGGGGGVIIIQARTRESGCGVGRRGNIQNSKHMVYRRPPADHQMWENYVTVARLAAKNTNQRSWLQTTLKSIALIKPHNYFSFLCFFPFLIIIIIILPWTGVGSGNLCPLKQAKPAVADDVFVTHVI